MMNVYTLCFVSLLLAFCLPSQAQKIDIQKGGWYMQSGKAKRLGDIIPILMTVPSAAYYLDRRALNKRFAVGTIIVGVGVIGGISGFVAFASIIRGTLGGDDSPSPSFYWTVALVYAIPVLVTTGISVLFFKGVQKNTQKAVEAYNASLDVSSRQKSPIELKLNVGVNSVGLAMVF